MYFISSRAKFTGVSAFIRCLVKNRNRICNQSSWMCSLWGKAGRDHQRGKMPAAKEEQHDMQAGIRASFEEMEWQLEKYKASLRREHWKRPERRERAMKAAAAFAVASESRRGVFFAMVTPHLERLRHFVE